MVCYNHLENTFVDIPMPYSSQICFYFDLRCFLRFIYLFKVR